MSVEVAIPELRRSEWRLRFFYMFAFAAGGVVQPFLNLYLAEAGLTGAQIGLVQGSAAFIAVLVTPVFGLLADRTQRHRLLLRGILFLKGISAPLLLVSSVFAWQVGAVSLRVITAQAQDAIMNRLTLKRLQTQQRLDFGSVRFWGGLSFAATSLLTGYFARDASVGILFPLSTVFALAAVLFAGALPKGMTARLSSQQRRDLPPRTAGLRFIFGMAFVYTLGLSGVQTFAALYLVEDLGAGNAFIGLIGAIGSLAPLPAFYLADWLVHRIGATGVLGASFVMSVFAWSGMAFITSAPPALIWMTLQGIASSLYLVALVILLGQWSLPQRAATDQMLVQLTVPGVAGMLAQPLSGWLFDALGGPVLFALDSAFAFLAVGVLLSVQKKLNMETIQ